MTERTESTARPGGETLADPQAYQGRLVGLGGYDDPAAVQATTGTFVPALALRSSPLGPMG